MVYLVKKLEERNIPIKFVQIQERAELSPEKDIGIEITKDISLEALGNILRDIYVEEGLEICKNVDFSGQFMTNIKQYPIYSLVYSLAPNKDSYWITEETHIRNNGESFSPSE